MAKIDTAEEAVGAAERFLSKYHVFRRLESVIREGASWLVEFDVGILPPEQIVRIRVDAETGSIIEYVKPKAE